MNMHYWQISLSQLVVKIQQKGHLKREGENNRSIFLCKNSFLYVLRREIAMSVIYKIKLVLLREASQNQKEPHSELTSLIQRFPHK